MNDPPRHLLEENLKLRDDVVFAAPVCGWLKNLKSDGEFSVVGLECVENSLPVRVEDSAEQRVGDAAETVEAGDDLAQPFAEKRDLCSAMAEEWALAVGDVGELCRGFQETKTVVAGKAAAAVAIVMTDTDRGQPLAGSRAVDQLQDVK